MTTPGRQAHASAVTLREEGGPRLQRFGRGFTFRTTPEAPRITFVAYGKRRTADLDRLVQAFLERARSGDIPEHWRTSWRSACLAWIR